MTEKSSSQAITGHDANVPEPRAPAGAGVGTAIGAGDTGNAP